MTERQDGAWPVDAKLSAEVKRIVNAQDKDCYRNAALGLSVLGPDARYVEGYAVADDIGLVTEHGWLELNGKVIDPTPVYHEKGRQVRYWPAKRYTLQQLLHTLGKDDGLPIAVREFRKPSKATLRARRDAWTYALKDNPPEAVERMLDMIAPLSLPKPKRGKS